MLPRVSYEKNVEPYLDDIEKWSRKGATDKDIAETLGIGRSTLCKYAKKYSELGNVLTRAHAVADEVVENCLYKKCTGYTVQLRKMFKVKNVIYENGKKVAEKEELVAGIDEVHIPADTNAQIFWLTNRQPEKWKRQPEGGQGDGENNGGVIEIPAVATIESGDAGE